MGTNLTKVDTQIKIYPNPSGESYECSAKLHPNEEETTNEYEFVVQTERVGIANEYEYMIEPLKRLARASILSGNPIHWT